MSKPTDQELLGVQTADDAEIYRREYGDVKIPTYEQLYEVYRHARAMCFGEDWNGGTHALAHRKALVKAVNNIAAVGPPK